MSSFPSPVGVARQQNRWSLGLSVVMIVAGIAALLAPLVAGVTLTLFVGWMVVLAGVAQMFYAFSSHGRSHVLWLALVGLLYLLIGIFLVMHPGVALATLTLVLAGYLTVEGVIELVLAFRVRPAQSWVWLLLNAVITLVLAVMIWRSWPGSSAWVIGTLIGLSLIFSGVSRLMFSVMAGRVLGDAALGAGPRPVV